MSKGFGYASIGVGTLLLWSSVMNKSVLTTLQDLVKGTQPTPGPKQSLLASTSVAGTVTTGVDNAVATVDKNANYPSTSGSLQGYAKGLLALHGWSGQWDSFDAIEMQEAGWSPTVKNSSSGALGIAQALGHGTSSTSGSLGNEYGGYGLSRDEAIQANSGNGYMQLKWMMNYIASRYGSPNAAETFHLAHGWY